MATRTAEAEIGGYYYDGDGIAQFGSGKKYYMYALMAASLAVIIYVSIVKK